MDIFEARVIDATHLELSRPLTARQGETVRVVVTREDEDSLRKDWLTTSAASLNAAYGDCEPDYSSTTLREPNPDYSA